MNTLRLEVGSDGVAVISIDVPGGPFNIFTPDLVAELEQAIEHVLASAQIRGAVLTSAKRSFMAGADLKELLATLGPGTGGADGVDRFRAERELMRRMETGGKPFAAAINGLALGGGLELCLACHYRVLADDPQALLGLPEVRLGLLPAGGGTQRLPRLVGIEPALPLLMTGGSVAPAQALELGIVHTVIPRADIVANARRWVLDNPGAAQPWDVKGFKFPGGAGALAPHAHRSFMAGMAGIHKTTQGNYPAPIAILSAVFEGTQVPIDLGLRIEAKYAAQVFSSPVARNLVRTLFVNKGIADKLGRRPRDVPKSQVRKLGVLGAGMMGAGIAYVAAAAGIDVVLLDATQERADEGKRRVTAIVRKDVEHGRTNQDQADAAMARIRATIDYALLGDCDFVIEAVFEDRTVKTDVMRRTEAAIPPTAIFASNTSTLPITGLAQNLAQPARFIGVHFFSPVERMPLVEIILGNDTSPVAVACALDLVGQLRKTPILVNDSPGFYTSRVFCSYIDEGMAMLEEGIGPALIENAARGAGMASGPLAVTDEVSLDLQQKVIDQARTDGLPERYLRIHAQNVISRFNAIGRLGRKSGGGFYEFPANGRKHLWPGLAELYPPRPVQPPASEVRDRLLYIQALEAARCVEEGVITEPMDADLGAILGLGFPSWTGGPLSFIDTVGMRSFVDQCRDLAARHGKRFEPSPWLMECAENGGVFHARAAFDGVSPQERKRA